MRGLWSQHSPWQAVRRGVGAAALWLLPLVVICEYLSGAIPKPAWVRLLFFSLFLGAFWISELPGSAPKHAAMDNRLKRLVGALIAVAGFGVLVGSAWWLAGPKLGLPPSAVPAYFDTRAGRLFPAVLAAWPIALGAAWWRGGAAGARAYERLGLWIALAFLLHFFTDQRVQGLPILPSSRVASWVLAIDALVLVSLIASARGSFVARLGALVLAGLSLQLVGLDTWALTPHTRDMLPLVESAQTTFARGENPYTLHSMVEGSAVPLTYLPGLWLGFAWPRLLGLDIRLASLLAQAAFIAALAWTTGKVPVETRTGARAFVTAFGAVWFFSPSVHWNTIYAEPPLWCGLLGACLCMLVSQRSWAAAVLLGLTLATRHFAVVLAPFALLYMVKTRGLRDALPRIALAGVVACALITPFALADADSFWFGTFRWLREYGFAHVPWFRERFSFMRPFEEHGALGLLPWVQWGQAVLCLCAAFFARRPQSILGLAGTAYVLFLMLNVLFWDSFVLDGAVFAACAVVGRQVAIAAPEPDPLPRVLRLATAAGLLASGVCAVLLLVSLIPFVKAESPTAVRAFLLESVRPGDAVIDRSDRRLAFVRGTWLLRRNEVPAPIGQNLYDGAWAGNAAIEAHSRVWLISRDSRDQPMRAMFPLLGRDLVERQFGRLKMQSVMSYSPTSIAGDPALKYLQGSAPAARPRIAPCVVGSTHERLLMARVSSQSASVLRWPQVKLERTLFMSAGLRDKQVAWRRGDVHVGVTVNGEKLEKAVVPNRLGMHWAAWDTRARAGQPARVEITLSTSDPEERAVCLDVSVLREGSALVR